MAQLAPRFGLNLANAFASHGERLADFFEGALIAVLKAKAQADYVFFARI